MKELDQVKKLFIAYQANHDNPLANTSNNKQARRKPDKGKSYSTCCMDYRALMQRIREPYNEMLHFCPDSMKSGGSDLMTRIQSRYEQLSTTIETAVRGIHKKFVRWVNAVISGKDFDYHQKISDGDREGHVASDKVVEMLPGESSSGSVAEGLKRSIFCRTDVPEKLEVENSNALLLP